DLQDFSEWYQNAPQEAIENIDWTVPEPGSASMLMLAGLFLIRMIPRKRRNVAMLLIAACVATCLVSSNAVAQDVVLEINRTTNNISITTSGTGDLDGYAILSDSGSLDPTGWSSLDDQGLSNWREAGTPSTSFLAELQSAGTTPITSGEPLSLGTAYDPLSAKLAAGFAVDIEDVQFDYHSPNSGTNRNATVTYVGEKIYNNLVINVDPDTGAATLENESPFAVELNGYTIRSEGGFLDPGWSGLRDLDSDWQAANPTVNSLSELNPVGSYMLAPAESADLGFVYTGIIDLDQDLTFDFTLTSRQAPYAGIVKYASATMGVTGDFNQDGAWDCDDINALTTAIAGGSTDLSFDMNGDGAVTIDDIAGAGTGWLAVGGSNNPAETGGNPFLGGDANLDGVVDVSDFGVWNSAKFTQNSNWCGGDFNADGVVDVSDFGTWNANKFTSSSTPAAVPEPAAFGMLLLGFGALLMRRP
ncbi:MAG: PEP-CTERM sorting domain-containing protein, partial [Planctomycetota bacterium]